MIHTYVLVRGTGTVVLSRTARVRILRLRIWQNSFVGLNCFTYDKTHNIDKQKDLKHLENELHGPIGGSRGATTERPSLHCTGGGWVNFFCQYSEIAPEQQLFSRHSHNSNI